MLEELRIRDLGVIDEATLELGPGFTVITGETGAGKTMVLTSLGLLFGGRSDPGVVRSGAAQALVEGRIAVAPGSPAAVRADEAGAELDSDSLLLARTVSAEGRSRAFAGGRTVPAGVLAELAEDLVAVHGQSDQQRLLRPSRQRNALDRFAGEPVASLLVRYTALYESLLAAERTLDDITVHARERAQEADVLRAGLERIEAVDPQPGEDVALLSEENRLANADELRGATARAHEALMNDGEAGEGMDATGLLAAARSALDPVAVHDDQLASLRDRLTEVSYLLADVAGDLASYAAAVDTDPARLAALQDRRAALTALTRRYGESVDEVLAWGARAAGRLAELEGDDVRVEELVAEVARLRQELAACAQELSSARQVAAERFGAAVTVELAGLALPHARLEVAVRQNELERSERTVEIEGRQLAYGPTGIDEVELLLSPHPGAVARPLGKGASGGELSRVMLAVEVVFAGADPVPTFVFDEVDAGVGGKAAIEVGRRLATLARNAQVLVVTHLPQVAAYADAHLTVVKSSDGSVTRSGVLRLDPDARVRELARMLAGAENSQSAQAHAEELLSAARSERA